MTRGTSTSRLIEALAAVCKERLLDEKWLIAPSRRTGYQWLDRVARSGQPAVNVRVHTPRSLVVEMAGHSIAEQGVRLVSRRAAAMLLDRVFREVRTQLAYLRDVEPSVRFAESLCGSIEAIRLAGCGPEIFDQAGFEDARKGADLKLLYHAYLRTLAAEQLVDYAQIIHWAREQAAKPARLSGNWLLLLPEDQPPRLSRLEKDLLEALPAERRCYLAVDEAVKGPATEIPAVTDLAQLRWLLRPAEAPTAPQDGSVRIVRAVGEVNEVRAALRHCAASQFPLDQLEVLHTDAATYVPLIYETLAALEHTDGQTSEELPVTFAEGLPCRYSRPGRALLAWVRWCREGFPQTVLVRMLHDGLLHVSRADDQPAGNRWLAKLLRGLGIGFGRDRYLPQFAGKIQSLEESQQLTGGEEDEDGEVLLARRQAREREIRDLRLLRDSVAALLNSAPADGARQHEIVSAAKRFLATGAGRANKLDQFASQRLLEELTEMEKWLDADHGQAGMDVWEWLVSLPQEISVMGSGPQPGKLHVDNIYSGGHTGRPHTMILGLDDSRFPGAGHQDPLLLDSERQALSAELPTAAGRLEASVADFAATLARLRGELVFSFSCRDLVNDREMFPSPVLLSAFRVLQNKPLADLQDLAQSLPPPASFAPANVDHCLNTAECWLSRLTGHQPPANAERLVLEKFAHLGRGRRAADERLRPEFTEFDGCVPEAGRNIDPARTDGMALSSSRLETAGSCPLKFYFKYVLGISPPDELVIDPDRWLDSLQFGQLLHSVFEQFMREIVEQGRLPEYPQDLPYLETILQQWIESFREANPPASQNALARQIDELQHIARTFLSEEADFCLRENCMPVFLEANLGQRGDGHATDFDSSEPVPLSLAGGRQIRIAGRIDRIDRVGGGSVNTFGIWDYKTGSDFSYKPSDPFQQGRHVQPYLYASMVAHRLREMFGSDAKVAWFGFFFPGRRAAGKRMKWTPATLNADGRTIVGAICDIIAGGAFLATDKKDDCGYCDFQTICGDVSQVTGASQLMLANPANLPLKPMLRLRPRDAQPTGGAKKGKKK